MSLRLLPIRRLCAHTPALALTPTLPPRVSLLLLLALPPLTPMRYADASCTGASELFGQSQGPTDCGVAEGCVIPNLLNASAPTSCFWGFAGSSLSLDFIHARTTPSTAYSSAGEM